MNGKNPRIRINAETKERISAIRQELGCKSDDETFNVLLDLSELAITLKDLDMSVEQAISKLKSEKTEIKVIRKGVNDIEFEKWKGKLMQHNESSTQENRVHISQQLFLDIIGGNRTTLSKIFRDNEKEIDEHNEKMGTDRNDNRKLSSRIREKYGTVSNWLKCTLN